MLTLPAQDVVEFDEFMDKVCKSNGMYASPFKMSTVMRELEDLSYWRQNRVCSGLIFTAPTSASTQASGAVRAVWRVNVSSGIWTFNNSLTVEPIQNSGVGVNMPVAYLAINDLPVLGVGQSVVMGIIGAEIVFGGVSYYNMLGAKGPVATTGTERLPTDNEIITEIGTYYSGYIKIAKLTLNRTADTVVTQTQDNTWRDS
jgi:hypothetical protein